MLVNKVKMLLPFIAWSGGPTEITCNLMRDGSHKSLLSLHNWLNCFRGGLRIFGTRPGVLPTLQEWNKQEGWRSTYKDLVKQNLIFFAEDAFGNQFAYDDEKIVYFNAEIGRATSFANSFAEWLSIILEDPVDTLQLIFFRFRAPSRER